MMILNEPINIIFDCVLLVPYRAVNNVDVVIMYCFCSISSLFVPSGNRLHSVDLMPRQFGEHESTLKSSIVHTIGGSEPDINC